MGFGQLVIGPPGSGKTTYCNGMQQFLTSSGRKVAVINLDPANDSLPYECKIDVSELIRLEDVMEHHELGPNGGLMFCMEYIEKNIDWLLKKLIVLDAEKYYFLFDCPGQVELYTHHNSIKHIVEKLQKLNYRITAVNLIDSFHCGTASNYISVVLLSLNTMMQLELPHINVLSKIDLIEQNQKLAFNLDYYTDVLDLKHIRKSLDKSLDKKYKKLNKALCDVIEDYRLVAFSTLNIQDKESVCNLVKLIDKSNGYIYGGLSAGNDSIFNVAVGAGDWEYRYPFRIKNY